MTRLRLSILSVEDLVALFVANRLKQDEAELAMETRKFKPLYREMVAIRDELRSRPGDQRHALVALLDHPNKEVRLNAAKSVVAIAPTAARKALEGIAASRHYPQAADAQMSIDFLDDGRWVPT